MSGIYKKNLTLLVLALAEGAPLTPVQLQKAVFLLQERLPDDLQLDKYEFVAHNYGPFSSTIYKDAADLAAAELAIVGARSGQSYADYAANEGGIKLGQQYLKKLPPDAASLAKDIVSWVRAQTFRSLVSAIYQEYPKYKVNSVFKG